MSTLPSLSPRATNFRQAISDFIVDRRETKLKGLSAQKAAEAKAKYEYHAWIADAARRVSQIQAVTHILKASHPDARGTSLHIALNTLPERTEIGTHNLGHEYDDDIVGNAAALDVYKFLKIEVENRRLLDWLQQDDPDLLAAFHADTELSQKWAQAFKGLAQAGDSLISHTMAKQVYWCISGDPSNDENFHLLQTLFPSSLLHVVHSQLNDARYGEFNKEVRKAYYAKTPHNGTYRNYPNLSVRKLGGTKPQNISQLNSERGGVNYLLSCCPPKWIHPDQKSYLGIGSALKRFRSFEDTNLLLKRLITLLKSDPEKTIDTRQKRERIEQALAQALANFGGEIRYGYEPGWTRNPECDLPLHQKIWLDMDRAELALQPDFEAEDREFQQALEWNDWPDQVATDFALWLNAILREEDLPVGDAELKHWAKQALADAGWLPTTKPKMHADDTQEFSHD
ncbi:MAG: type I-F CRISPR-associated protein Csy1 [bacterium]